MPDWQLLQNEMQTSFIVGCDEPPFHVPVFVLTHRQRASIEMSGGTTFYFVEATPQQVLAQATAAADAKDVRVGGDACTVREFPKAGLVNQLHLAIAPIVLGRGINLWDDLRGFDVVTETAESDTVQRDVQPPAFVDLAGFCSDRTGAISCHPRHEIDPNAPGRARFHATRGVIATPIPTKRSRCWRTTGATESPRVIG